MWEGALRKGVEAEKKKGQRGTERERREKEGRGLWGASGEVHSLLSIHWLPPLV
jgi:hypothetical protein